MKALQDTSTSSATSKEKWLNVGNRNFNTSENHSEYENVFTVPAWKTPSPVATLAGVFVTVTNHTVHIKNKISWTRPKPISRITASK